MFTCTNQSSPKAKSPSPHGFTLLEVVIALTLLAIFSGTLFSIVRGSVQAATEIEKVQQTNDQVNRFIALCRQTFQNLPATAILTLTITQSTSPVQQELGISGVPECFPFGISPISYKETILGIRPDMVAMQKSVDGIPLYYLGLSREDLIPTNTRQSAGISRSTGAGIAAADDQGRYWMPLLPDVTTFSWRFYKKDEDTWEEEWDSTSLPELVEMNLLLRDRSLPIRVVFALPTAKLTAADASLAPATGTTNSTQNGQGSGGGNNGGGGRGGNNQGEGGQGPGRGQGGPGRGQGQGQQSGQGQEQGSRGGDGAPQGPGGQNSRGGAQPSGRGGGSTQGTSNGAR